MHTQHANRGHINSAFPLATSHDNSHNEKTYFLKNKKGGKALLHFL